MLNLVLVEAALETVPRSIIRHPSVRRNAKRRGKKPEETLLDRSLHHAAMRGLVNSHKRGRPDIVHFCLLEALGAPLNREGMLRLFVHTYGGYKIEVSPEARLPRDYTRFCGLMEQLFAERRVPPGAEEPLLELDSLSLRDLMGQICASRVTALTSRGHSTTLEETCRRLARDENPAVFIGAFPSGPMGEGILSLSNEALSIYPEPLDAWIVTSRLIYEFERAHQLLL